MAKFITNIQLQHADEKDYDTLHTALEKASFKSNKSNIYISTGNHSFSREGNITLQDVIYTVSEIVSSITKKYSFTVIKDKSIPLSN